ncbi:MAG TPA: ATP-binding cassette domain-containing protein, partial [Opitutaceae bacterium]|nr:ATP-binding cassette domain-containing protein [Opitutaceae bacterium]
MVVSGNADAPGPEQPPMLRVRNLDLFYGAKQALHDIVLDVPAKRVTALIGPSGCGKSTLLRCFNRMNDLVDGVRIKGQVFLGEQDIFAPDLDVIQLRKHVGMVFQKSNPFPKSIFENIAYGLRIAGMTDRAKLSEIVEKSLRGAALWDEVKDRREESG